MSWTSASLASSRDGSECSDKQKLPAVNQIMMFVVIGVLIRSVFDVPPQLSAVHVYNKVTLFCFVSPSYVLLELVETERDYVRDLGSVVEVNKKNIDIK